MFIFLFLLTTLWVLAIIGNLRALVGAVETKPVSPASRAIAIGIQCILVVWAVVLMFTSC